MKLGLSCVKTKIVKLLLAVTLGDIAGLLLMVPLDPWQNSTPYLMKKLTILEEDLENENDPRNEDTLKYQDYLKNEDEPKNENDLKNESEPKMQKNQKLRSPRK